MHASRPDESVVLKISAWMLLKVGFRFGVGPASVEMSSSQAAVAAKTAAARPRPQSRTRIESPFQDTAPLKAGLVAKSVPVRSVAQPRAIGEFHAGVIAQALRPQ